MITLTKSQHQALSTPHLAHTLPDLNRRIELARIAVCDDRQQLDISRRRLNQLLARRAELTARADRRLLNDLADPEHTQALEDALSGEGQLVEKLAAGLKLCNCQEGCDDCDPHGEGLDPDEDEPTDDSDEDDSVLAVSGEDDQEMARAFQDEVERLAAEDIHEALADAAMSDIHGGAPDDEHYCDGGGDA